MQQFCEEDTRCLCIAHHQPRAFYTWPSTKTTHVYRYQTTKASRYIAWKRTRSCISLTWEQSGTWSAMQSWQSATTTEAQPAPCYTQSCPSACICCSIAEMLFCTSLMAYVGAGEQPTLTPRKLSLINTAMGNVIQDISLPTSVLAVRLNRERSAAAC